jgi:CTP synthase
VPYIRAAGEIKTKPTQHSVGSCARSASSRTSCSAAPRAVIEERDVDFSIYECPLDLYARARSTSDLLVEQMARPDTEAQAPTLDDWDQLLDRCRNPSHRVEIAVVGKYIELHDAYKSIYESLTTPAIAPRQGAFPQDRGREPRGARSAPRMLAGVDGVLVPGGFGERGIEGKIRAARYARENGIPYLGICYGMQAPSSSSPATCCTSPTPRRPSSRPKPTSR